MESVSGPSLFLLVCLPCLLCGLSRRRRVVCAERGQGEKRENQKERMSETDNAIIRSWIDILAFDRLDDDNKRIHFWSDITTNIINMSTNSIKNILYRYPDFINIILNHTTHETYDINHRIWRSAVQITMKFIHECNLLLWLEVYFSSDEVLENALDVIKDVVYKKIVLRYMEDILLALDLISELILSNGNWQSGCGTKLGDVITNLLSVENINEREFLPIDEKISLIISYFSRHLIFALTASLPSHLRNKRISTITTAIEFYCFLIQDRSLLSHIPVIKAIIERTSQFSYLDQLTWKSQSGVSATAAAVAVTSVISSNSTESTTHEDEIIFEILSRYYQIISILFNRIAEKYSTQSRGTKVILQSLFPSLCKMISCPIKEECGIASLQLLIILGQPVSSLSLSRPRESLKSSTKQEKFWLINDYSSQYRVQFTTLLDSLTSQNMVSLLLGLASMNESLNEFSEKFPQFNAGLKRTADQLNCLATIVRWKIDSIVTENSLSPDDLAHLQEANRILRIAKDRISRKYGEASHTVSSPRPSTSSQHDLSAYQYLASDSEDENDKDFSQQISRTDLLHLHHKSPPPPLSSSGPFTSSITEMTNDPFSSTTSTIAPSKSFADNPFKIRNEQLVIGKEDLLRNKSQFPQDKNLMGGSAPATKTIGSDGNWLTKLNQSKLLDLRPSSPSKESHGTKKITDADMKITSKPTRHVAAKTIQKEFSDRKIDASRRNMSGAAASEKNYRKGESYHSAVSGAYFGEVLDTHGDFNYEADLDQGYEHLFTAPKQEHKPKSSVPDVMSLLGSMMAAASNSDHSSKTKSSSSDNSRGNQTSTSQQQQQQPSVSQSIIKISVDSFFSTLLSLPLKSYATPEEANSATATPAAEKRLDLIVPNRFINEEQYIRTFQILLEAEVDAMLKEFIVLNGRGGGGHRVGNGNNNRRDQRELRLWGGAEMKQTHGHHQSNEIPLPRIFVRCALVIDRPGSEDVLSEVRVGTVTTGGGAGGYNTGNRGANLAKDDLIVILHPNHDRDHTNVQSLLQVPHTLGIVTSQGKEQNLKSSSSGATDDSAAAASNDYNHQTIVVLKGTLPPSELTWTCIPLIGLSTNIREWTALHSVVSHQLMPLTPYILKASPVVSAHRLSEIYRQLDRAVNKIMVGHDRLPRQEDLSQVHSLITLLDGFHVDISVLKAVDMVKLCKQIESRDGIDTTIANRLKDLRAKWKHQVRLMDFTHLTSPLLPPLRLV
jgi:hypothetical protein